MCDCASPAMCGLPQSSPPVAMEQQMLLQSFSIPSPCFIFCTQTLALHSFLICFNCLFEPLECKLLHLGSLFPLCLVCRKCSVLKNVELIHICTNATLYLEFYRQDIFWSSWREKLLNTNCFSYAPCRIMKGKSSYIPFLLFFSPFFH